MPLLYVSRVVTFLTIVVRNNVDPAISRSNYDIHLHMKDYKIGQKISAY